MRNTRAVPRAFPNLTEQQLARLAEKGIDPEWSLREWLVDMVGDRADDLLEETAGKGVLPLPEDPDLFSSVRPGPAHGTWYAWKFGCRCEQCRAWKSADRLAYRQRTGI